MDQGLKERLIGAAVLVALGVWLIPWVLDGPSRASRARVAELGRALAGARRPAAGSQPNFEPRRQPTRRPPQPRPPTAADPATATPRRPPAAASATARRRRRKAPPRQRSHPRPRRTALRSQKPTASRRPVPTTASATAAVAKPAPPPLRERPGRAAPRTATGPCSSAASAPRTTRRSSRTSAAGLRLQARRLRAFARAGARCTA